MSTLAPDSKRTPAPSSPAATRRRRGRDRGDGGRPAHALDEPRPDVRVGLIGTVLVHLVLVAVFLALPEDFFTDPSASGTGADQNDRPFEIELNPELFEAATPPLAPLRFVEVNPAAPENVPDETELFGKQNQQVAQPTPTPEGESDTPSMSGSGKPDTTAIVSGLTPEEPQPAASELLAQAFTPTTRPTMSTEAEQEAERQTVAREAAAKAVNPLPGGETVLGESDGGVGTTVATVPPVAGAETGTEAVKGTADGRATGSGYFSGTPAINRTRPQERPRLTSAQINARQTPTIKNDFGSKNIGAVAYSAKWSSYGEYLQRLIDTVQAQWERLILRSSFYPTSGSTVRVVFKLDAAGLVSEIVRVDGSGAELAQRLCVSAITERAPYGDWSEDMIAVLGREQELTFTFYYQ